MKDYTTKEAGCYSQLTVEEREEIAIMLEKGSSKAGIGRATGRHKSTVSREVRRNGAPIRCCRYRANQARARADKRRKSCHAKERLSNPLLRSLVIQYLTRYGWTPGQIAGRIGMENSQMSVCYETIYMFIYTVRPDLIEKLVRGHKKRRKRGVSKKSRTAKIPNRTSIEERPAHVDNRNRGGHWEIDTVVSRQSKAVVAVMVERKSRFYIAVKCKDKTAESISKALVKALSRLPRKALKTLTYDNGTENVLHELVNITLGTRSYFCNPYHSWEKGSIENRNGVLRRFFPKRHNWGLTKQHELDKVVNKINAMPMKCLGFKTPSEVFAQLTGVALAT
jgi:IS30 family transposase